MEDKMQNFEFEGFEKKKKRIVLSNETNELLNNQIRKFGKFYVKWLKDHLELGNILEEDAYKFEELFGIFEKCRKIVNTDENGKSEFIISFRDISMYKEKRGVEMFQNECLKANEKYREQFGTMENIENAGEQFFSPAEIQKMESVGIIYGKDELLIGDDEEFIEPERMERWKKYFPDGYKPLLYQYFIIPKEILNKKPEEIKACWQVYREMFGDRRDRENLGNVRFCTIAQQSTFESYLKSDDYYLFVNRLDPFSPYQFHKSSQQYMDADDKPILS
jgi:hypothetical protein